jgi:predicted Zn-ribbon and HTH transcriptional regulator
MCGGGGPMNLTLEETPWEKYRCDGCGKTFLSMAKKPRCPDCRSDEVRRA